MKTDSRTRSSLCLDLTLPKSWGEMTQQQLRYIFYLQSKGMEMQRVKIMFLLRMAGIQPFKRLEDGSWLVASGREKCVVESLQLGIAVQTLDWMDEPSQVPVCLQRVGGAEAIDPYLHGLPFGDYLVLDNYYQGYLNDQYPEDLLAIAKILYPDLAQPLTDLESLAVLTWVISIKVFFAHKWNDLFAPASGSGGNADQESLMNAMIRALTAGDVLKEKMILEEVDTWRALTELNEKARENRQLKENTR